MLRLARLALVVLALLALGGCVNKKALSRISSGLVGRAPPAIQIEDNRRHWMSRTWTASCGERQYYCSSSGPRGSNCSESDVFEAATTPEAPKPYPGRWSQASLEVCPATVDLPARPEEVAAYSAPADGAEAAPRASAYGTGGDGPGFYFSGVEIADGQDVDRKVVVREAIEAISSRVGGRVVQQRALTDRAGQSAVIASRDYGGQVLAQVFVEGGCLYTGFVAPRDQFATTDVLRFFKSIRVAAD